MKIRNLISLSLISFCSVACGNKYEGPNPLGLTDNFEFNDSLTAKDNESINVVLLYGQSNATGFTASNCYKEINEEKYNNLNSEFGGKVFINYNCENFGNASNGFVPVKFGQGVSTEYFGPEIGIADVLSQKSQNKTFIIKYTYGGTGLNDLWLDGNGGRGDLYNFSVKYTLASLKHLKDKGFMPNILGICWMQGENDAVEGNHNKYYENTKNFVSYYREDYKNEQKDIKFIDAKISDSWSHYKTVNEAKQKFANDSDLNYLVDTIELGLTVNKEPTPKDPDKAHYDSESMVVLGNAFGNYLAN